MISEKIQANIIANFGHTYSLEALASLKGVLPELDRIIKKVRVQNSGESRGKRFRYSQEQLDFIRSHYKTMPIRQLTPAFNKRFGTEKTRNQIRSTLKNHNIQCGRKPGERFRFSRLYTEDQVRFLKENYAGRSIAEVTDLYNAEFGTDMTRQQIKTFVHNRGVTSGRTGQFEQGHKPWNAGTKGQGLTGPNSGSFKKGSVPPNRRPLGSERIDSKDGYILVKVAQKNPYTGHSVWWRPKHILVWEEHNGPVPEGKDVMFVDGDRLNCDISNLRLVTRAERLCLNRYKYREVHNELKPTVLAMAQVEVKAFERGKDIK